MSWLGDGVQALASMRSRFTLVVSESTIEVAIEKASLNADKQVKRQVDVNSKDVDAAVVDTVKQLD